MNRNPVTSSPLEVMHQAAAEAYKAALGDDVHLVLAILGDICQTPMAALTIIGIDDVHVAAAVGLTVPSPWARRDRLHELLISTDSTIVIADPAEDAWLAQYPLVAGTTEARFAAAAPLHAGGASWGHYAFSTSGRTSMISA